MKRLMAQLIEVDESPGAFVSIAKVFVIYDSCSDQGGLHASLIDRIVNKPHKKGSGEEQILL